MYSHPHSSSAHRTAALALYRALLVQTHALRPVLGVEAQEGLRNIVRNRFKQARHEQSTGRLRLEFEAAYEGLDHVDAARAGDEASVKLIQGLVERAPERVKRAPPPNALPKQLRIDLEKRQAAEKKQREPAIKKISLLDRPLPLEKLSGRRRVPVLYNAQKIPVLRFDKPQPHALSGYIAHRVRLRQKRHDQRGQLEAEIELAKAEDRWDEIVAATSSAGGSEAGVRERGPAWVAAPSLARREVERSLDEEKRRNGEMAAKMQGIVDQEQALYDQEKVAREVERKRRWVEKMKGWMVDRKRAKSGSEGAVGSTGCEERV